VPSPCTSMVPSLTNLPAARFLIVLLTPAGSPPAAVVGHLPLSMVVVLSSSVDCGVAVGAVDLHGAAVWRPCRCRGSGGVSPVASNLPALPKLTV